MERREFLKRAFLGGFPVLTLGCILPQQDPISKPYFKENSPYPLPKSNATRLKQASSLETSQSYNLERIAINGYDLYVEPNLKKKEGEADFYFILFSSHQQKRNDEGKIIGLDSAIIYAPQQVKIGDIVQKTIVYSPEGEFGKRAKLKEYKIEKMQTGVINEAESDRDYDLMPIPIAGSLWYVPLVEKEKLNEPKSLPFYLIPVKGTIESIDNAGIISIKNENGFYRPIEILRSDYEKREVPAQRVYPNSRGQAGSIAL